MVNSLIDMENDQSAKYAFRFDKKAKTCRDIIMTGSLEDSKIIQNRNRKLKRKKV